MDSAARYTVTTLLRYAIMVVAIVSVFSLLSLRWSELQWMVAALTLGLGFGLQEVVANFVSGLIMLFERPVRVGDTITIGEFSGTVARIRTRATTVIDWDNREIVVPNKNFITERLINWSLSDTMTRIVLTIGVSYDSDVDLVMQSLKEIAEQHPLVMKDPAPTVLFLKLGDSALNFEMRVYVAQLRERMETTSDLHRAIIRVFRERGIEISFPQMDLHIRDVATAAPQVAFGLPSPAASTLR
jgi:potassium efflux system protein